MPTVERVTVTLTSEMINVVKDAIKEGDYASSSEVVREALRDWKVKRELRGHTFAALKAEIDRGLSDVARGRTVAFEPKRIIAKGRKRFAANAPFD